MIGEVSLMRPVTQMKQRYSPLPAFLHVLGQGLIKHVWYSPVMSARGLSIPSHILSVCFSVILTPLPEF